MDPTNFQINIRSVSFDGWYCPNQLTYCYDERYIPKNSGTYLNYYFSYDVCACFRLSVLVSVCLSVFLQKNFLMGMDQARKFGKLTSRILEFKPEGLDF